MRNEERESTEKAGQVEDRIFRDPDSDLSATKYRERQKMNIHEARKMFAEQKRRREESQYFTGHSGIRLRVYQPGRKKTG